MLPGTATHRIASTVVGDTFEVSVSLPLDYDTRAGSYPVIVALDADLAFAATAQVIRLMQYRDEVPASIVVGVGYGALGTALVKRLRDLTPTSPEGHAACNGPAACGGADRFLRFLLDEMLPFVADRYRVHRRDATLFGASLGGLFGGFVLAREPDAFDDYVLGSPTVSWDDGWLLDQLPEARPPTGRVFVGVGGAEGRAVLDATRLAQVLTSGDPASGRIRLHVFEGERHMSVQPMVLSRGMRTLAESRRAPPREAVRDR